MQLRGEISWGDDLRSNAIEGVRRANGTGPY